MKLSESIRSTLSPQTLIAIKDFSFVDRARAIPGVEDASESFFEVAIAGTGKVIEPERVLQSAPEYSRHQIVTKDFLIVGGLSHDQFAENPIEAFDGQGELYHRGRRGSADENRSYYQALGLDGDGNPNMEADVVCQRLATYVWDAVRKDRNLVRRLKRLMARHNTTRTVKECIELIAGYQGDIHEVSNAFAGQYVMWRLSDEDQERLQPVVDHFESHKDKAWEDAVESGELGNKLAQRIDIYEHGGVAYSLAGEGMSCRWDTSRDGAIWAPDRDVLENLESIVIGQLTQGLVRWGGALGSHTEPLHAQYSLDKGVTWHGHFATWKEALDQLIVELAIDRNGEVFQQAMVAAARTYCRDVLEEYTRWVNGECYGVCIYMIDRHTGEIASGRLEHEVWGYIGNEHAEAELEAEMLHAALTLGQSLH